MQEIYLRICGDGARVLTGFRDTRQEAIYGYLKVVATNAAHDSCRRRSAQKRGQFRTVPIDSAAEVALPGEAEQRVRLLEIERMLENQTQRENGRRDRAVFRLYYRYGMTAEAIAGLPGIGLSVKGVEGVLLRLTRAIRNGLGEAQGMGAG